jgi:TM2 domain-containing membrane protein YozV
VPTSGASIPDGRWRPDRRRRRALALAAALTVLAAARGASGAEPGQEARFVGDLLRLGLGDEAGIEAHRLLLENGPEALTPETTYRVGMALAVAGKPDQAVPFLEQAAAATADPTRADQIDLTTGVVLLRARSFPHAVHVFARVEAFGADEATRAFATRLRCVAEVLAHDGAAARACIAELPGGTGPPKGELDGLLRTIEINVHARGIVGGALSVVIPGLGQLTAGNPGDAGLALLVNGGFATAVYFLIADGAIGDAALVGLGLGLRYYFGNIHNGAEAWRAAAERQRDRASERLIRILGPAP